MSQEMAMFWFGLSGIFGMLTIHYFFEAIKPNARFDPFSNLLAFQRGLMDGYATKTQEGSS